MKHSKFSQPPEAPPEGLRGPTANADDDWSQASWILRAAWPAGVPFATTPSSTRQPPGDKTGWRTGENPRLAHGVAIFRKDTAAQRSGRCAWHEGQSPAKPRDPLLLSELALCLLIPALRPHTSKSSFGEAAVALPRGPLE